MSCEDCERIQEEGTDNIAYVRIGTGNVAIIGCNKHLTELIEKLRSSSKH